MDITAQAEIVASAVRALDLDQPVENLARSWLILTDAKRQLSDAVKDIEARLGNEIGRSEIDLGDTKLEIKTKQSSVSWDQPKVVNAVSSIVEGFRSVNSDTGEIESYPEAAARIFGECFNVTPRLKALERYKINGYAYRTSTPGGWSIREVKGE